MTESVFAKVPEDAETLLAQQAVLRELLTRGGILAEAAGVSNDQCEALYQLGYGFYAQARYSEAFQIFSLLVSYNHLEARYLTALAGAAQMLGRYPDAVQHYATAAMLLLDDPAPLIHAAECCLAMERPAEAAEGLRMALEIIDQEPQHEPLRDRVDALLAPLAAAGH